MKATRFVCRSPMQISPTSSPTRNSLHYTFLAVKHVSRNFSHEILTQSTFYLKSFQTFQRSVFLHFRLSFHFRLPNVRSFWLPVLLPKPIYALLSYSGQGNSWLVSFDTFVVYKQTLLVNVICLNSIDVFVAIWTVFGGFLFFSWMTARWHPLYLIQLR